MIKLVNFIIITKNNININSIKGLIHKRSFRETVLISPTYRTTFFITGLNALSTNSSSHADNTNDWEKKLEEWKKNVNLELLNDKEKIIHNTHLEAIEKNDELYKDPFHQYEVHTIVTHLKRGKCCGNGCRHCPYEHVNVPEEYQYPCHFNSAFYSTL